MEAALRTRVVDVALMRPHALDADIRMEVVHEEPLRAALRHDHALANQRDVSLEELSAYPLVGYRHDISPYFRHLIQGCSRARSSSRRSRRKASSPRCSR